MKKICFIALLLMLIVLPIKVSADKYYVNPEFGSDDPNYGVNGESTFCIDPGIPDPSSVDGPFELNWNSNQHRSYLGAYKMMLARNITSQGTQKGVMRALSTGSSISGDNDSGLAYCAGIYAAGLSGSESCAATLAKNGYDPRFLRYSASDFESFNIVADNNEYNEEGIYTFKLSGSGVDKIKELIDPASDNAWKNLKAELVLTSCSLDSAATNAGFRCQLMESYKNLLQDNKNEIKIKVYRNSSSLITTTSDVKVTFNYRYDFPFGNITVDDIHYYECTSPIGANCDDHSITYRPCHEKERPKCNNWDYDRDSKGKPISDERKCQEWGTEKYWVQKEAGAGSYTDDSTWPEVKECNRGTGAQTQRLMDIPSDGGGLSAKSSPKTGTKTAMIKILASCQTQGSGNNKKYYVGGKEVSVDDYLKAGCCKDVNKQDIDSVSAREYFRKNCMEDDTVYLENQCGAKAKLGTKKYEIINGSNVNVPSCENDSYVDYTHSYVWQVGMDKILARVNQKEDNRYFYNISSLWSDSSLSSYAQSSYLHQAITGKDGKAIGAVSYGNNYCMLLTSETNDIYFPGTAIATSGRFFVFNELNKQECANAMNPGSTCFRQPYVLGNLTAVMHTDFDKWDRDYRAAIEKEKNMYNAYGASGELFRWARSKRQTLEQYKSECEGRNNLSNYLTYNLTPDLKFSYSQKVYGGKQNSSEIEEKVDMEISKEAVKYWPNVSSDVKCNYSNSGGSNVSYSINYGGAHETKSFTNVKNYTASCNQTIYYKPKKITYSTVPDGKYILSDLKYQSNPVNMIENGIEVGYVYNVQLTTYEGAYTTNFDINNLGNKFSTYATSAIQQLVDKFKKENSLTRFSSECIYCDQEGEFSRVCDVCPDPNNPDLGPRFISRTISLSDPTPNDRANTNWSDAKGKATEERIKSLSGDNIVATLTSEKVSDNNTVKATFLGDIETKKELEPVAKGNIYNDQTKEYLEYEITLSTKDMQIIKANTERSKFDYGTMNICSNTYRPNEKGSSIDYCFICNADGKECESSFVDAFANSSITTTTRNTKWKYFMNGKWEIGNWNNIVKSYKTLEGFENGRYPDPLNQKKFLEVYSNWP